jgi:hypothetical protein
MRHFALVHSVDSNRTVVTRWLVLWKVRRGSPRTPGKGLQRKQSERSGCTDLPLGPARPRGALRVPDCTAPAGRTRDTSRTLK